MKTKYKVAMGLLAAIVLPWTAAFCAGHGGTEFGINDDLTVFGAAGNSTDDPDVEIKGFTVFGSTEADHALDIPKGPGNIYVNGYVQVSSGMYISGSSTFAARVSLPDPGNIFVVSGNPGEVLKKQADGSMGWGPDNDGGGGALTGLPLRLLVISNTGVGIVPSLFLQNSDAGTNITMVAGSSMTILGDGTDGLGVTGAVRVDGDLNVNGDVVMQGAGRVVIPGLPAAGTDAANKDYVDFKTSQSGPWGRNDPAGAVFLSTAADSVGIGLASPAAKLHISSAGAAPGDMLVIISSGPAAAQRIFMADAAGSIFIKGNTQQGAASASFHGVNMAPAAGTALSVAGEDVSGDYAAKFYSGGSLAVWIKRK